MIVAGEDITDWTEEQLMQIRRRVTMVFQSGALFDSLTVGENIAFPLTDRDGRQPDEQIDARVAELAQMLEVTELLDKLPVGTEHRHQARRGHCAGAGAGSRSDSLRRADDHGRSADGRAHQRPDLKLKETLHKTSVVVTHDTHLAKKLADRLVFLAGWARGVLRPLERI